jgi:hypothetical protein
VLTHLIDEDLVDTGESAKPPDYPTLFDGRKKLIPGG